MIRFSVQPNELILKKQIAFDEQNTHDEVEVAAEPLDESDAEFEQSAKDRHTVGRKLKVLRRTKVGDWLDHVAELSRRVPANIAEFTKDHILDKAAPGLADYVGEKVQRTYEVVRDSTPVKFIEDSGYGERARLFLFENGPSASIKPKIEKLESELIRLTQKQQQEAREFNRVSESFGGQDIKIDEVKKEKSAYWQGRIDLIVERINELKKIQDEREGRMEKLSDGLNNKIDNKIAKIKKDTNFEVLKEEHKKLAEALKNAEAEEQKAKEEFENLKAMSRELLDDSNFARKFDQIFNKDRIEKAEESLSDIDKKRKAGARGKIQEFHKKDKVSLENILQQNIYALQRQREELDILKSNIAKLRKSKDKVDKAAIKAEHRIKTWELQRKRIGVSESNKKIGKGDFVNESISREEIDGYIASIDQNVTTLFDKDNPSHWFTAEAIEKCKVDGINVGLNEDVVARGLAKMRQDSERAVFDMEKVITNYINPEIPKFEQEVSTLEAKKKELGEVIAELKGAKAGNVGNKLKDTQLELDDINLQISKIKDLPKKLADLRTEYESNIARLKTEILPKIAEDITSKQRTWSEYKTELFKLFPDLAQYEHNFSNKGELVDVPGMPENVSGDAVDKIVEKVINDISVEVGDDSPLVYERLLTAISGIENDKNIKDKNLKKEAIDMLLNIAIDNLVRERSNDNVSRAIALLGDISAKDFGADQSKRLTHFLGECLSSGSPDDKKTFENISGFLDSVGKSAFNSKISNEQVSSVVQKIFEGLMVYIEKDEGSTINKAKDMADMVSELIAADKTKVVSEDQYVSMYSSVVDCLNRAPHTIFESDSESSIERELGEAHNREFLGSNVQYVETLRYIHSVFMESGIATIKGQTLESITTRANALIKKNEDAKLDPKLSSNIGPNFTHMVLFISELSSDSHLEISKNLISKAIEIAGNDKAKLFELAMSITETENPDLHTSVLEITDLIFNSTDNSEESLFWKLKSMELISSELPKTPEGGERELESKFDSLFETNKDTVPNLFKLCDHIRSSDPSLAQSAAAKQCIQKIFGQVEYLNKSIIDTKTRLHNLESLAWYMENEGMRDDAERISKEADEAREKLRGEEDTERLARGETEPGYLNELEDENSVDVPYGDDLFPPSSSDLGQYNTVQSSVSSQLGTAASVNPKPKKKGFFANLFGGLFGWARKPSDQA